MVKPLSAPGGRKKYNKYGNVKCDGHDSVKESKRARELRQMELDGLISDLREQVKFVLIPTQYSKTMKNKDGRPKVAEKECSYIADFVYLDANGETVIEDSKGFETAEFKIKRKLMLYLKGIEIKIT